METNSLWQFPYFLTKAECVQLIELSQKTVFEPATVDLGTEKKLITGIRNNLRSSLCDPILAQSLYEKIKGLIPKSIETWHPVCLSPEFRFYKYETGQRFKKHRDGITKTSDLESRITFLIYLNENFEGGETKFENTTVKPATGTAICFLQTLKHESLPIISGTKYVLRTNILGKSH